MENLKTAIRKDKLRALIMQEMQANSVEITGDFWFTLVFRTEKELEEIARELNIKVNV
jgi:hypothetical protein